MPCRKALSKLKHEYREEPTAVEMIEALERESNITERDMDELKGVLEMYFVREVDNHMKHKEVSGDD